MLRDLVDVTAKLLGDQGRFLMTGKGQVLHSSSILLNVFINHLDDSMESSFGKSGDGVKLGEWSIHQRGLGRLEKRQTGTS